MKNNFLKLICCLKYFILLNTFSLTAVAQLPSSEINDKIVANVSKARRFIEKKDQISYNHGVALLLKFEKEIIATKDDRIKLLFYRAVIEMFVECKDYNSPKQYFDKGFKILKSVNNKKELGLFYEYYGVLKYYQGSLEERNKYYLIAEDLLKKYGSDAENIDINFNLTIIYKEKKEWKKSIHFAKKALKNINSSKTKLDRIDYLHLYLAENYLNLNNIDSVGYYLKETEKNGYFIRENSFDEPLFYQIKGEYLIKTANEKQGFTLLKLSNDKYKELFTKKTKELRNSYQLSNNLKLAEYDNKRIKNEIKLKNSNIKYKNYVIILGVLIIIILIILTYFQNRNSKFKTKVNTLLKENNYELIKANKQLKEAINIKKTFLDTITHELRTPLNTIKGISYLLKISKSDEEINKHIESLNFSSDYLSGLINNIIDYNLIDKSKNIELNNKKESLKKIVELVATSFKITNKNENKNEVVLNYDTQIPQYLLIDNIRLNQILFNLMSNSSKFTSNGKINLDVNLVKLDFESALIKFQIADTGIGIPSKMLDKVFDLFVQASTKINRDYGGSGIGLSIVKKNIALFGSTIHIESKEKAGTTVTFEINFKIVKEAEIGLKQNEKVVEIEKKVEILLVEDNKINQMITKKIIESKGYKCEVANDGLEAVKMTHSKDYSLILMDIMMPNMDGFEASAIISKEKPYIPIIALTAISEDVRKEDFLNSSMITKLSKPLDVELLCLTIEKNI
jgi:signal transduction histidine kinase/CheY-like chemotaxis protein